MTNPDAGASLAIDYAHSLQVRSPAPAAPPPLPPPPRPAIDPRIRVRPGVFRQPMMVAPIAHATPFAAMATPAIRMDATPVAVAKPQFTAMALHGVDMRRVFIPRPTVPQGDTIEQHAFSGRVNLPLSHPRTETAVYPDLPLQSQNGWDQHPDNRKLHFRDSGKTDTFFFLPTMFKLGYYFEPAGGAVHPPLRVDLYRDGGGSERIKATLVAAPCIEAAERQALRTYLDEKLLHLQPFIKLDFRSGIQAEFAPEFVSGSGANLPVQIKFLPPDVVADERVKLFFDMPAEQYPIFCELLKFGIFGSVKLSEPGLNVDVPVHLQFEQMTTNMLRIEQAAAPAPAQAGDPPGQATL